MTWYAYELPPIDFGWEHLPTVREALSKIAEVNETHPHTVDDLRVTKFMTDWALAQNLAREVGWEGDHRERPRVFWVPGDNEMEYGFVIKQENNGDKFVMSPHELPWLKSQASRTAH